jgi:hypothetical protein
LLLIAFEAFISRSYFAKVAQASNRKGGVEQPASLYILVYKGYHVAVPGGAIDNTAEPPSHIFEKLDEIRVSISKNPIGRGE